MWGSALHICMYRSGDLKVQIDFQIGKVGLEGGIRLEVRHNFPEYGMGACRD